ncbi:hypothetical protein ACTWQL_14900 [Pseudalkalibacillus sp. R45]|uniref:hypothetical protein n=1 Tax=Pseudalkalibacillus sp. R45 TaxID=3457433 RepID=UPI003FCDCF2F
MGWFFGFLGALLAFAGIIDWRRKKNKNTSQHSMNPNAKSGESSNYVMGDNRYSSGSGGGLGGGDN